MGLKRANSENTIEDKKTTEFKDVENSKPKDEPESANLDKKGSDSASTESRGNHHHKHNCREEGKVGLV